MKTLHGYLTRQVLAALVMTVVVFTFVFLLANLLKEITERLMNHQASLFMTLEAVALLIPFVLVFALPMGMLTATLLVFGRFSADQELTAVRAGGVSLVALITPILLLSVALSGVCALINMEIAPQCRVAYKRLLFAMGMSRASTFLPEKTFIKNFPGYIVYADKVDRGNLKDVLIYILEGEKITSFIRASEGKLQIDRTNNIIHVQLVDAWRINIGENRRAPEPVYAGQSLFSYTNKLERLTEERVKLTEMTWWQLQNELRELEKRITSSPPLQKLTPEQFREQKRELEQQRDDLTLPVKVQIHRQVAFSFACIGFTLVGIPLGVRAHRRETSAGIAMALILVMLYYSFFILGQALETRPEWFPNLILWLPNFVFQAVGAVLLWRANRGV